jgi:nucleoid-associated protein YgaU
MDFDFDGPEDVGGRILWGRVAVFGGALLLALILGRCTAGGGGVPEARFSEVLASASAAESALDQNAQTIATLQQELQAARTPATGGGVTPTTPPTGPTGAAGTPTTDESGNRIYTVQSGDTLSTIAEAVYGDPTAFGIIAQANNIGQGDTLTVGESLIIPPNPDAAQPTPAQ